MHALQRLTQHCRRRAFARIATELPTGAEFGAAGYDITHWYGILAPVATSRPVMVKLNSGFVDAVKSPEMTERFSKDGVEPVGSTMEQFQKHIAVEIGQWQKVVTEAGIKVD